MNRDRRTAGRLYAVENAHELCCDVVAWVGIESSFVSSGSLRGTQVAVAVSSKPYGSDVRRPVIRQQSIRICGDVEQRNDPENLAPAGGSRDGYTKRRSHNHSICRGCSTMQTGSFGGIPHEIGFNRRSAGG